jgi:FAD/FMN-containing dehydrogenase
MANTGLRRIVGEENVLTEPELLEEYTDRSGLTVPAIPGGIVRPANATEVREIIVWANESGTPLVPVSSGPPHRRGDTAPGTEGAIIVDLSRMNNIIRIDKRNRLAMIEPGVTFGQLQAELVKEGLTAYLPLLPRGNKSVIGSVLEREPITRPAHHWDSTDPLLCAEVVFGSGERFRTGEASGPDTIEEQWEMYRVQMNPFGHSHVDFQRLLSGAQGTIGIVTWITLKCNYLSEISRSYFVPSYELEPLLDLSYQLLRQRSGGYMFIVNNLNLACLLKKDAEKIQKLRDALPPWILFTSFEGYGILPEDKVNSEEADYQSMAAEYKFNPVSDIAGASAAQLSGLLSGISPEPYWKTRYAGDYEDIFFLTTLDKTPDFTSVIKQNAGTRGYSPENIGVYIQPIVQGTSCHCEFNLYHEPVEKANIEKLVTAGCKRIADTGGFFSRPYSAWKDIAYRQAAATAAMQRKVKQLFDPNEILNPGKLCF